jgi:Outer membrane protein beta-barrel domain
MNYSTNMVYLTKFGYSAGLGITQRLTPNLQLQGKVLFERKGYKTSQAIEYYSQGIFYDDGLLVYDYEFNNLTFSVTPQLVLGKKYGISIGAGAYYGLLRKATWNIYDYVGTSTRSYVSVTQAYIKGDYGVTLNVGYSIRASKILLLDLQLTGNYGLRQLALDPPPYPQAKLNLTTSFLQLVYVETGARTTSCSRQSILTY